MDRRRYLSYVCCFSIVSVTGCIGSGNGADEDAASNQRDDLDEQTIALANVMGSVVDDELTFLEWRFSGDRFIPEFITVDGPEVEIPILGRAFAEIVADGFAHESMPTGVTEDDFIEYMVYIQPEWAKEYNSGELSEQSYFEQIEATIH